MFTTRLLGKAIFIGLAYITTAMTLSDTVPAGSWEKLAALGVVVWAVVKFLFTPLYDTLIFRVFERNEENQARLKRLIDNLYKDLNRQVLENIRLGGETRQRVHDLEVGVERLSEQVSQEMSRTVNAMTVATREQTKVLEESKRETSRLLDKLREEITQQGKQLAGLTSTVEAWSGLDRRHTHRRAEDQEKDS